MENQILVITSSIDAHADFLCPKLEKMGVQTFRFDTDNLGRYDVEFGFAPTSFSIRDKKKRRVISKRDITSVWYRKPSPDKTLDQQLDEESLRFSRSECKEWIKSIAWALRDSFWITEPWVLYQARIKTNQLSVAQEVGLRVPRTLVTRSRKLLRTFFGQCPNDVIAKALKMQYVETDDHYYTLSTQEVTRKDLVDPNLYVSPCIFQERIATSYELRVVAIGNCLFPFKVIRKAGARLLDIRANGLDGLEFAPCEITPVLQRKIHKLLKRFCLSFSSMDFLVDKQGNPYFVDLNPNGQWLWLEIVTGIKLSDEFAKVLINRQ